MTDLRITVRNTSEAGGTVVTPFYFGFHNGGFDLFNPGEAASPGLERLAEDGIFAPGMPMGFTTLADERLAGQADSQGGAVVGQTPAGDPGPIGASTVASNTFAINGEINQFVSFGAMILPSNDAFVGTDEAVQLFDENGAFLGASTTVFEGSDVYDAGTEVNTEEDAAFINQTAPDTGVDEGGVVRLHPGFNGSLGNPEGEGDQIILGGTNAFGQDITEAADFTRPGAQIAEIHINTVVTRDGTSGRDKIVGAEDDDIVNAGDGRDLILTGAGYDVIDAGAGRDIVLAGAGDDEVLGGTGNDYVLGGTGRDSIDGGAGRDKIFGGDGADLILGGDDRDAIFGGRGSDMIDGGAGRDNIFGGWDDDLISGGTGNDRLFGGKGADQFVFNVGDGRDRIGDFEAGVDQIVLVGTSFTSVEDVIDAGRETFAGLRLRLDEGDTIQLYGVRGDDLSEDDFVFA